MIPTNSFFVKVKEEAIKKILQDNPKAQQQGNTINYIKCPACGKPEAYINLDRGFCILCHRSNKCGAKTNIKDIYPDLYENFKTRFPVTKIDDKATARAYLQSRGINTKGLEFYQGKQKEGRFKTYSTVYFKLAENVFNHRLIDYSGKNKNRNEGSYKNLVYEAFSNDSSTIYITEGIINALSLKQAGFNAIAIISSSTLPKEYYLKNQDKTFICAFDNDQAGQKAASKHIDYFFSNKFTGYSVIYPSYGKDWNDLLLSDKLKEANFDYYKHLGRLSTKPNETEYFKELDDYHGKEQKKYSLIFEFKNQTFSGLAELKETKEGEERVYTINQLMNCVLNIEYTQVDDTDPENKRTDHNINVVKFNSKKAKSKFSSSVFSGKKDFTKKLLTLQCSYYGTDANLIKLWDFLDRKSKDRPIVKFFDYTGLDKESGCFITPFFLYDPEGKRHEINNKGYFDKFNIKPLISKEDKSLYVEIINNNVDIKNFFYQLFNAYEERGIITFSFFIAGLFSHIIYQHNSNRFPFLQLYGDAHSGKSQLITLIRNCFFFAKEGVNSKGTKKGLARTLSKYISCTIPINEAQETDVFKLDILDLYQRGSLINNAAYSNDKKTIMEILQAGLIFVQNKELYNNTEQEITRFITLHFKQDYLTETTTKYFNLLKEYSPERLSFIGHLILTKRKYFEENIINNISESMKLYKETITQERTRFNYSVIAGTFETFLKCFEFDDHKCNSYRETIKKYILELSKQQIKKIDNSNHIADEFFQMLLDLSECKESGYKYYNNELRIYKTNAEAAIKRRYEKTFNRSELISALKNYIPYIKYGSADFYGTTKKVYCFDKNKISI